MNTTLVSVVNGHVTDVGDPTPTVTLITPFASISAELPVAVVHDEDDALAAGAVAVVAVGVIMYDVIGCPPVFVGAVQLIVIFLLPATTAVGALI